MLDTQPLAVVINGRLTSLGLDSTAPLVRAVVISLFTWRRANADDALPAETREGWWGDTHPVPSPGAASDRIGSRLWLLTRAKLLPETARQAREYAEEALAWLVKDGVAARVEVEAERHGIDTLALACRIYRRDGTLAADVRFNNVWETLNGI